MDSGIDVRQLDRFFKLVASVVTLVTSGKRSIAKVCDSLQKIVNEPQVGRLSYTRYYAPGQRENGMTGFAIEQHLRDTGLITRAFSLEDELVKNWLASPVTYPGELKAYAVFLWNSRRDSGVYTRVACLCWDNNNVVVDWVFLSDVRRDATPALLTSS